MRVVMTGAGDFIGAHLLARMVATGMDVTLLGSTIGKSPDAASLVAAGTVRFLRCDDAFAEEDILRPALADADALVLLGYITPTALSPGERLAEELARNVAPVVRLLRAADKGPRQVVFASSVCVYGSRLTAPVRESDTPRPRTPYALAKIACEESIQLLCEAAGWRWCILRYSTVYGPGETVPRTIPNFIRAALAGEAPVVSGDGLDERDYINIADVVDATLAAVQRGASGVYNIGSGVGTTTIDLARLVVRLAGIGLTPTFKSVERRDQARTRIICATKMAARDLGFNAARPLPEGLTEEIGWFRSQLDSRTNATHASASG
jgi:nucleoside-diphosphate-sugar epimerase